MQVSNNLVLEAPAIVEKSNKPDLSDWYEPRLLSLAVHAYYSSPATSLILNEMTYVAPSVIIPRLKRNFTFFGCLDPYLPQSEKGLLAKVDIKEGTYIGTYEGYLISPEKPMYPDKDFSKVIWLHDGGDKRGVDGENALMFANHQPSSKANMRKIGLDFYAASDISKDKELTWSYDGSDNDFKDICDTRGLEN